MLDSAASAKTNSDDPASAAIDTGSGHDVVSADFFANERPMNIDHLEFALECPALSSGRNAVLAIRGEEALGKPFEFRLWVAVASRDGWNDESLIGQPATLVTSRRTDVLRRVHGIIGEATRLARDEAGHQEYELLLVPRLSLLGVGKATEIFLDATVPEIIQAKLKRYGLSAESRSVSVRLVETYPKLEFVVQYEESDLAFISRLAEHVGIALHVVTDNDVDVVVLSDSNTTYPVESPIPFTGREMTDAVVEFSQRTCLVPGRVRVADYNYRAPKVPLEAQVDVLHGAPSIEAYEYGPHSKTPAEVARVSRLRAEEVTARRCTLIGRSHLADVAPGTVRTLEDHPLGEVPLLMTAVHHRYGQLPETRVRGDKSHGQAYENTFVAIRSSVPFRPARDTVRPRIAGVVTGVVEEDTKSHAARIDEAGRYFVEFHFAEPPDGRARICRPVRMVQSHVGPNHGIHFPLRPGSEVALAFVNGDPDRPVILGGIPNALTPSPVTAGNRSFSTIRTLTGVSIEIDDGI